jgi:hypothetical protein
MANTVIALRQSGATGNTPSLGVLANGELSLNYADSILYFKTVSNTLGSIRTTQPAGLTTEIQFNDAGSFGTNSAFNFNKTTGTLNVKNIIVSTNLTTVNLTATSITTGSGVGGIIAGANVIYSNIFVANSTTTSISNSTGAIISNGGLGVKGNVYADAIYDGGVEVILFANQAFNQANSANVLAQAAFNQANTALSNTNLNVSGTLRMLNQGGDEGGELFLDKAANNTSLAAGITIDIFQNKLRFFETGGSVRGVFIDIANSAAAGVGTDLLNPAATPDTVARTTANAAFNQANSANVLAQSAYNQANSVYLPSVTRLNVTHSGSSAYLIDQYTGNNPELYIRAGETLAFNLDVTGHPFLIRVSSGGTLYNVGLTHVTTTGTVTTNSSAQAQVAGTLYWKVPAELAGNTYVYQCQVHGGMVGNIVIERPNQANSAAVYANSAFDKANSANVTAESAFFKANTANVTAEASFFKANTANVTAEASFSKANSANVLAQASFNAANTAQADATGAFSKANSANVLAQNAYDFANTISGGAAIDNVARASANSATTLAQAAFNQANTAITAGSGDALAFAIALG